MKSLAVLLLLLSVGLQVSAQSLDTLTTKRIFIRTEVYRNGFRLPHQKVKELFSDTWQPKVKYKWGYYMNPVAPVITIAGVGLAAVALKGNDATTIISGKEVNYKVRSLPKLLMGIGLAVGGLCLIESSNELVKRSVDIYNARQNNLKTKSAMTPKLEMGVTESQGLGLTLRF